jgi:hypothetical protein
MDRLEKILSPSTRVARRLLPGLVLVLLGGWLTAAQAEDSLVGFLSTHAPAVSASTVPARGDLNPYGVAFVPEEFPEGGPASAGDVLIANFNGPGNAQGTGTTVVRITPAGGLSTFFAGRSGLGLSTGLWVLKRGFVVVGNVPSTDGLGVCTTGPGGEEQGVGQGSLLVLDRHGHLVKELTSAEFLDGPWDLTVRDEGSRAQIFVSNVLNGTVSRIDLAIGEHEGEGERARHGEAGGVHVLAMTRIASGYQHRCDPAAFVVGPTGLALDADQDVLYVAATADNAIYAIRAPRTRASDAGIGELVTADAVHLHGPVGLVLAPNGDIVATQGDAINPDPAHPSEISEFTASGRFVAEFSVDPLPGSAFGMAVEQRDDRVRFAAVDDGLNVLDIWTVAGGDGHGDHRAVRKAAMVATTTVLTPSMTSVTSGTMINLSATVTGASPTGNVSFYDNNGTTLLGSAALASGTAMKAGVSLAVGSHNLTAIYAGDANNSGSTSAVVVVTVTACTYGCGMGGGGGGGGYGGGAFGATELALLVLGVAARRRLRRQGAGGRR